MKIENFFTCMTSNDIAFLIDFIFHIYISYLILLRRVALQKVDFQGSSDENINYNI